MECKRYLPPSKLDSFYERFATSSTKSILGHSVQGRPIYLLTLGSGPFKVLMWSQMHGNESTTTKALVDFIPWFEALEQKGLQTAFTLYIILQLNPDGAYHYTRNNANDIDLNRDAIDLTQPESIVLRKAFEKIRPDLCLNLHGQRTIYAAGTGGLPASLSFLAPAADLQRSITPARKEAMRLIVSLTEGLYEELPDAIGRYDDTYNPNCVGDYFTQSGTPTILFEAGHVPGDYQREKTRIHLVKAYKILLNQLLQPQLHFEVNAYQSIPQNTVEYFDVIASGVCLSDRGEVKKNQQLAIQYTETLKNSKVFFEPQMAIYGEKLQYRAHKYLKVPSFLQDTPLKFEEGGFIKNTQLNEFFSLND